MQYLGGKSRIAKRIAEIVNARRGNRPIWDPFCGGLSSAVALGGSILCSDVHSGLIALYRQGADLMPDHVSEDDYRAARFLSDDSALKAFIGFGCAFGGKWFGGYARPNHQHPDGYARHAKRSLAKKLRSLPGVYFACLDFCRIDPRQTDFVIYADPPYRNTTGYRDAIDFDLLQRRLTQWARYTEVFVSEYDMPNDWTCLWQRASTGTLGSGVNTSCKTHVEKLFWKGP